MPFDSTGESTRLRALGHPLRLRILELLGTQGPLTATEVGERLQSSPSNCSFHLRMLNRAGFIEEAPGAPGRNRPWRLVEESTHLEVKVDDLDDGARHQLRQAIVAGAEQYRRRALTWLDTRHQHPEQVRAASGVHDSMIRLTPDELATIDEGIEALLAPFENRPEADAPDDAIPVALTIAILPVEPPPDAS